MNIVIETLDCWNLWAFIKTCCNTKQLVDLTAPNCIIILNKGLPHQELVDSRNYVLMDLFYKVFDDFNVAHDPEYKVQSHDRFLNDPHCLGIEMPNNKEYYNPTLARNLGFIRKKLTKNIDVRSDFSRDPKILYISRSEHIFNEITINHRHWTRRIIKNNQDIKRLLLTQYSGEILEVDRRNLPTALEQLNVVCRADILFGIHGAGLNWIIAAKNNAALYEFFPKRMFQYNGTNMTQNLGLSYHSKHISSRNNSFNVSQIFSGLDETIRIWKDQASGPGFSETS